MFKQAIAPQYLRERKRILLACSLILALVATFVIVANAAPSAAVDREFAKMNGDKASVLKVASKEGPARIETFAWVHKMDLLKHLKI
ncbi:hypothetical protein CIP107521_02104 [Corynebacterium diphtheriae]|nr:hypothetical protein CIP107521_02104 [Corynebacterium diphtheriae]